MSDLPLRATVSFVFDVGGIYAGPNNHVGFGIHIQQGNLRVGDRIKLSGTDVTHEMQIVGVELGGPIERDDPLLLRIHCKCAASWPLAFGPVIHWELNGVAP